MKIKMTPTGSYQWLVGYGTFITGGAWQRFPSCRICRVPKLRRVYNPEFALYPFAIDDEKAETIAICFSVDEEQLDHFDRYEGVDLDLYERVEKEVLIKESNDTWIATEAWIYLPTSTTKQNPHFPWEDSGDRWLHDKIQKLTHLQETFPEFFSRQN